MNERQDRSTGEHPAPFLLYPTELAVIDGTRVPFRWDPVSGATGYRIEVASDHDFDHVVYEKEVGTSTSHVVENAFRKQRTEYYWRVVAHTAEGEELSDIIESFVSTTSEDAAAQHRRPDRAEKLGPLPELITGGSEDVLYLKSRDVQSERPVAVVSADDDEAFYEAEDAIGVEHEGLEFGQIWKVIYSVIGMIVVLVVVLFVWTRIEIDQARSERAAEATNSQIRSQRAEATRLLEQYSLVDSEGGVYRIPIDRAMDLMLDEEFERREQSQ